ncbi:hypothetical protein SAMN04487769_2728 [Burkholderia sp. b14]|nr:hypothetical protein SAMN04487769_2728 [Burkholderia sp. b14]
MTGGAAWRWRRRGPILLLPLLPYISDIPATVTVISTVTLHPSLDYNTAS